MAFIFPQGITVKADTLELAVTSLSVSLSAGEFDITTIVDTPNNAPYGKFRPGVMKSADISIEWLGAEAPRMDDKYEFEFGGAVFSGGMTGKVDVICTSSQVTAQAGELIKGTASFKVTHD